MNMFVRTAKQPANHTVFAGFGKCDQSAVGAGRYLCKFAGGEHFWSHGRDVEGRIPLDLNTWQMLTATYDGLVLRLYKDGKKISESPLELSDDENVVNIAPKDPWDSRYQFNGEIRGFTIWSAALNEESLGSLKGAAPK
jgi:alpha-mannosidase